MKKYIVVTIMLIVLLALAAAAVNLQLPSVETFTLTGPGLQVQPALKTDGLPAPGRIYPPPRVPQYRIPRNAECLRKCA